MKPLSLFRAGKVRSAEPDKPLGAFRFLDREILLIIALVIVPVVLLVAMAGLGWI